jgi:hypothetical protein
MCVSCIEPYLLLAYKTFISNLVICSEFLKPFRRPDIFLFNFRLERLAIFNTQGFVGVILARTPIVVFVN